MSADEPIASRPDETSERRPVLSRRTLIKAGWTAPIILTVAPAVAFAASGATQTTTQTVGGTTATRSPGTTTTTTSPTTTSATGNPSVSDTNANRIPEQQSSGPQPARIDRGFTG